MPWLHAASTASLTSGAKLRSSAVMTTGFRTPPPAGRAGVQTTLRHVRTAQHFAHHGGDLGGTEIEPPIEIVDRLENLGVAQVRVMKRKKLTSPFVDQFTSIVVE